MAKKSDKVEREDEVSGTSIKVTHEGEDGAWHALVKISDDAQRRKNLNFVEDSAEALRQQLANVQNALAQAGAAVTELEQTQAAAVAPPPEPEQPQTSSDLTSNTF